MPGYREPTPEELEESRDARVARQQLDRLEIAAHYLEQAARLRVEANQREDPELTKLIARSRSDCINLETKCEGRVEHRRRPRNRPDAPPCTLFLDECGQHVVSAHDAFPVFVLSAIIIADATFPSVDDRWKQWKQEALGSDAIIHEPDVRRGNIPFKSPEGKAAAAKLPDIIRDLDFAALAVVVHRADYLADFGEGPIDASLPAHVYLLALDFLMERVVFALDGQFNGARAAIVVESRGAREDATLQHEFARLHLEGTSYVSPGWFRQQFYPGIRFLSKKANHTGLQLADLLARPVGEKVAQPDQDPPRWAAFRDKLCLGQETKNSIVGLKVVPWRERYEGLWKS